MKIIKTDIEGVVIIEPRVFADARTNSILLSGSRTGRLQLRALIAHLDTPLDNGGDTQVIFLNYASAKDLVPILEGVAATLTGIAPPTAKTGEAGGGSSSVSTATIQAHDETNSLVISAPPAVTAPSKTRGRSAARAA